MTAFLLAVLVTYLVGSALSTQVNLASLRSVGLSLTLSDHLNTTAHDLRGLAPRYLPLLALALLPGLVLAAAIGKWLPRARALLYPLCAALCIVLLHVALRSVLGVNFLGSTREWNGLVLQGLAGWAGGYGFFMALGLARR